MNEKKNVIIGGLLILFFTLFVGAATVLYTTSRQSNELRATNDKLTEQLDRATDTNRRLTETVEQCQFLCGEFEQSIDRNITTVREAIEVIEETRYYVQCIEVELGLWDSDSIYNGIDNWLENEGVKTE